MQGSLQQLKAARPAGAAASHSPPALKELKMEGEDEIQEQEKQQQVSPSPSLDSKPQSSLQKLKIAAEVIKFIAIKINLLK